MLSQSDREYHKLRAQAELDCAYRAENYKVAEAHMRLSALHMQRLRDGDLTPRSVRTDQFDCLKPHRETLGGSF